MLTSNHPDDERLSALAADDADAAADASLGGHVTSCARCTELVTELRSLRASLAELPDLRPSRPLRLLPEAAAEPVGASAADRLGGWIRRYFSPVLAAGAAVAMVGLIGTAAPALSGGAAGAGASPSAAAAEQYAPADGAGGGAASAAPGESFGQINVYQQDSERTQAAEDLTAPQPLPADRSPWPMVLFSGVALMIAAVLLRWILAPRAP